MILKVDKLMDLLRPAFIARTFFNLGLLAEINGDIMRTIETMPTFFPCNSIDLHTLSTLYGVYCGAVGVLWRKFKNGMFAYRPFDESCLVGRTAALRSSLLLHCDDYFWFSG